MLGEGKMAGAQKKHSLSQWDNANAKSKVCGVSVSWLANSLSGSF